MHCISIKEEESTIFTMMQPPAEDDDDDEIFVYMGGDQQVPHGVRRAKIHISVKIVREWAFFNRRQLIYVECHDGVEIIEKWAFHSCQSLRSVKLLGVKIIKEAAFFSCDKLTDVEFGDKLETIESQAFNSCSLLRNARIPSVRTIGRQAFSSCYELSDLECGEALETLQWAAFGSCPELKRIALPLKRIRFEDDFVFDSQKLTTLDLVGGVQSTVATLHMESWRNEMTGEINRINQVLPNTNNCWRQTGAIQQWMESTVHLLDHYTTEHHKLMKEATTLLELALWKANLGDNGGGQLLEREGVGTTRGSRKRARREICVTSGANIVIKNVLPFLQMLE